MTFSQRFVVAIFKGITSLICRIHDAPLELVPKQGPLIIVTNHINILEIPIIYTHLQPRRVHGMVLADRWKNPIFGWILDVCETIPLHRDEADLAAIRKALKYLEQGEMLIIAPEGTRSGNGRLQPAHAGMVLLALHSHAPLLPAVFYGAEHYKDNLSRLQRTDFHLRVGKPFYLEENGGKATRLVREKMMDEVMYQLAAILPAEYRGEYADLSAINPKYVVSPGNSLKIKVG